MHRCTTSEAGSDYGSMAPMTKLQPLLTVLSLGTALAISACSDDPEGAGGDGSRTDSVLALTGDAAAGQMVFESNCGLSSCHGTDGNSGAGTHFSIVATRSNEAILNVVINGSGAMLPLGDSLTDQQLADVLAYIRSRTW